MEKIVEDIINAIQIPNYFGYNTDYEDTADCIVADMEQNVHTILRYSEFSIHFGVSKMAIVMENVDSVVIKIPFKGHYYNSVEDWLDEDDWEDFSYAKGQKNSWDYCAVDLENYQKAKNAGIGKMFARTEQVAVKNGHPIYIQEKVICYSDNGSNGNADLCPKSKEEKQKISNYSLESKLPAPFIADILDFYGEEFLQKTIDFLKTEGINDLHGGNIGYRVSDTSPVILDSSGWNEF